MKRLAVPALGLCLVMACAAPPDGISKLRDEYLAAWTGFYPSQAFSAGRVESAFELEDFSSEPVMRWAAVNAALLHRLEALPPAASLDERADRALLERQIRRELDRWTGLEAHRTDPMLYSELINQALTPVLVRRNLDDAERLEAVLARLGGMARLARTARRTLADGRPAATTAAAANVRATAEFVAGPLPAVLSAAADEASGRQLEAECEQTAAELRELARWLEEELAPRLTLADAYGEQLYARELALRYGAEMTPQRLEDLAVAEIREVRDLMGEQARVWWQSTRTDAAPHAFDAVVRPALSAMEQNRAASQAEFLQVFLDLIDRSEAFLEEKQLITMPAQRTLLTELSPAHFAGAAVGGVYPAGPFDPEAETLFYLPTVPDEAPDELKEGFYRSFNNHFNSMIITHEIYPGHYLQLKRAAHHQSPLRALFAGDDFSEGWASFCEQMMLDQGWDAEEPLTRLAHLRKRLENAVRAFVSVRVHCGGWEREQLSDFAVEKGLLPPQFAENLWRRTLFSPLQLPSYFLGFRHFVQLWRAEQELQGEDFSPRRFNDAVVATGGVPLELLDEFVARAPKER